MQSADFLLEALGQHHSDVGEEAEGMRQEEIPAVRGSLDPIQDLALAPEELRVALDLQPLVSVFDHLPFKRRVAKLESLLRSLDYAIPLLTTV